MEDGRRAQLKLVEEHLAENPLNDNKPAEDLGGSPSQTGQTPAACASSNSTSLSLNFVLFATIAIAQFIYADIAHSNALRADALSMAADALSFLGNLAAELAPVRSKNKLIIVVTFSGASLFLLVGFTMFFAANAASSLAAGDDNSSQGVNGSVVLVFALVGIVFDIASLLVFFRTGQMAHADGDQVSLVRGLDITSAAHSHDSIQKQKNVYPCRSIFGIELNMRSALLHIVADTLRSVTTLVSVYKSECRNNNAKGPFIVHSHT